MSKIRALIPFKWLEFIVFFALLDCLGLSTFYADVKRIGRETESKKIRTGLKARRHLLIEGPVGVGKTFLAKTIAGELSKNVIRVDGDERFSEQKLTGWFDPPSVLQKGYIKDSFVEGPLTKAMQSGSILMINELNRLPEGVQNVLLPALDEGFVDLPRLGAVKAKEGFAVIATQNPREFVATNPLSEALLDRFDLIAMDYQSEEDEKNIVSQSAKDIKPKLVDLAVSVVRMSRDFPSIKRGASVRAAIGIATLGTEYLSGGATLVDAFRESARACLPTRIEVDYSEVSLSSAGSNGARVVHQIVDQLIDACLEHAQKKK